MPRPKRGPQRPLTPEDLRDALAENNREIVAHFTKNFGQVNERLDRLEGEVRTGFLKVSDALDGTLDLFPTRKEVSAAFHRLSRALKTQGIEIEPDTLLPK